RLGYVFTVGGVTYYHAGHTDFLPAMEGIRCDVVFLPCDGHYTMDADGAARAAAACGAEVVVPIHWGDAQGTPEEVERLQLLVPGAVRVLPRST
ncbi:MAG TPA: MBL fold metallo-hydrolase, partial [Longimicrobiales bacterium]|nr:MBL fold metallo-hydrolase [Longimicrobiales bacterium]